MRNVVLVLGLFLFVLAAPSGARAETQGLVVVLRHALAPGTSDPAGFRLGDCTTQRNLDDRGRAQARAIGDRLRVDGFAGAGVFTSEWCRCRETAELLGLGPVRPLPALNSFFGRPDERASRDRALRAFLARLPADGPPVVLVTHMVNILALTGRGTASGGGLVLRLDGRGGFDVVRPLPAPPTS
jgi:broad specificity phosphatase PhoE